MLSYSKTTRRNLQELEAPEKTYAQAQMRESISLEQLASHIESHNSLYSAGDIMGVLRTVYKCCKEFWLNSCSVELGPWGVFLPVLKCNGVCESVEDEETGEKPVFTAANITGVSITWHKPRKLRNLMDENTTFEEVETVAVRKANLRKKKEELASGTYDPNGTKKSKG